MYTALTTDKKLGGVVALSCYLPCKGEFPEVRTARFASSFTPAGEHSTS